MQQGYLHLPLRRIKPIRKFIRHNQPLLVIPLIATTSVIAVVWNLLFNTLFEAWESRQARRGRSLARRIAHAVGFEGLDNGIDFIRCYPVSAQAG